MNMKKKIIGRKNGMALAFFLIAAIIPGAVLNGRIQTVLAAEQGMPAEVEYAGQADSSGNESFSEQGKDFREKTDPAEDESSETDKEAIIEENRTDSGDAEAETKIQIEEIEKGANREAEASQPEKREQRSPGQLSGENGEEPEGLQPEEEAGKTRETQPGENSTEPEDLRFQEENEVSGEQEEKTEEQQSGEKNAEPEEHPEEAELLLEVRELQKPVKAGETLLYEVKMENTGEILLENLILESSFSPDGLSGTWDSAGGLKPEGENGGLDFLEPGQERICYLRVSLPEELEVPVTLKLTAEGEYSVKSSENDQKKLEKLRETVARTTEITPLIIDFEVRKTADRTMAAAGDRVLYQICIRNTGERTLHSVLTTEKFQAENVTARFLEKDGVQFNQDRTKALISQIDPGQTVSLLAAVILPENLQDQELVNEVTVITAETGERTEVSQAKVQVLAAAVSPEPTRDPAAERYVQTGTMSGEGYPASTSPKTGDGSQTVLWLTLAGTACLLIGYSVRGIFRRKPRG